MRRWASETAPSGSSLEEAAARVGDRWTLLLVDALLRGPLRFKDLAEGVPGIAPNILSHRLRRLSREGIIVSRPYSQRPVRLVYDLSAAGRELAGALRLLAHWGARAGGGAEGLRHGACGTPLETRWYCPTCARTVEEQEDAEVRYV